MNEKKKKPKENKTHAKTKDYKNNRNNEEAKRIIITKAAT